MRNKAHRRSSQLRCRLPNAIGLFIFGLFLLLTPDRVLAQGSESDPASVQVSDMMNLFTWTVETPSLEVAPGETVNLLIRLQMAAEHFVYVERTNVSVVLPEGVPLVAGAVNVPPSKEKKDPADGKMVNVWAGDTEFQIPITAGSNPSELIGAVTVAVEHQGCNPKVCFFPFDAELPVSIRVMAGEAATVEVAPPVAEADGLTPSGSGFWGWLGVFAGVFLGGLMTAFTPCVYPLIPITLGILGARKADSRLQALSISATYVLGIAVMYTTLGVAVAATGAVFGQLMANPLIVGFVSLVLIALGLSMLGLYDLQLPEALRNRAQRVSGGGYGGAFGMGLVSGVIAAPCTGPMLGGILTLAATGQNAVLSGSLLFTFSVGLGMPFLVLGTFSDLLQKAPKAGAWMEKVKHVLAVLLFGVALFVAKDAFPGLGALLRPLPTGLVLGLILVAAGTALGGVHRSVMHGASASRVTASFGVVLLSFGIFLGAGAFSVVHSDLPWTTMSCQDEDLQAAHDGVLSQAKVDGKPVMIDFSASWCAACKELEAFTFSGPGVSAVLKERFELLKIDLTETTPDWLQERYGIVGLPLVLFIDAEGKERSDLRLTGFEPAEPFSQRLERALE